MELDRATLEIFLECTNICDNAEISPDRNLEALRAVLAAERENERQNQQIQQNPDEAAALPVPEPQQIDPELQELNPLAIVPVPAEPEPEPNQPDMVMEEPQENNPEGGGIENKAAPDLVLVPVEPHPEPDHHDMMIGEPQENDSDCGERGKEATLALVPVPSEPEPEENMLALVPVTAQPEQADLNTAYARVVEPIGFAPPADYSGPPRRRGRPRLRPVDDEAGAQQQRRRGRPRGNPEERPSWLPENWIIFTRIRTGGRSVGHVDKFYKCPLTGRQFRSQVEVKRYLNIE